MTDGQFVGLVFVIYACVALLLFELHCIKEILRSIERKMKSETD